MYDLTGISCAPHMKQEDLDRYSKMWRDRANDAIPEFKEDRVKYIGNRPVIPWKQASEIMLSQLKVMKRVQYGQ